MLQEATAREADDDPDALDRIRSALPEELRDRVATARELGRRREREDPRDTLATAFAPLDRLLEGGLPRGRLVELVGRRSSGRLSTLLTALAAATRRGEAAALVDLGDGLDPRSAADAGLDLERLLWLRPRSTKEAVTAVEILLEGGFPLVALDLGSPPVPGGRGAEAAWLRLARSARERRAALLVSTPYRVSGTAADTVLSTTLRPGRGRRGCWCRGEGISLEALLNGVETELIREKHRGSAPGARERATFRAGPPWIGGIGTGKIGTGEARHGKNGSAEIRTSPRGGSDLSPSLPWPSPATPLPATPSPAEAVPEAAAAG